MGRKVRMVTEGRNGNRHLPCDFQKRRVLFGLHFLAVDGQSNHEKILQIPPSPPLLKGGLLNYHCVELAGLIATPALRTLALIQLMRFFLFSCNRINGADSDTGSTAGALFRIDRKGNEFSTELSRTLFFFDMDFIFISEILDG